MAGHLLKELNDILLVDEAHLAVYLCELWLTVRTKVLVAEALGNLEVTVETSHHKQLLKGLRTLWKSIKLARVHT